MDALKIQEQIEHNRRTVAFDSYDITVRQLYDMVCENMIDVAPDYQRHFRWDETRQSQLIESIFLGIPVPSLFMATNKDSSWEVVDGLQRLTTIVNFVGDEKTIKKINEDCERLKITGLEKLDSLNGLIFEELQKSLQYMFLTRPIRVTVLNDRSDFSLRFDLFERLNTGGVTLHPQEIRNCVYIGEFSEFIKECAENPDFKSVVKLTKNAERTGNLEELVLKFFAYYEKRAEFVHSVKGFLNTYMAQKTGSFKNVEELKSIFNGTFGLLKELIPDGIVRGTRKNITPLILYEAISIGVADAIREGLKVTAIPLKQLLDDSDLNRLTTGATNSRSKLYQRIDFVKEKFKS
jgi:uncharacterized protein with ParB-like and HNH nuclease domain